MSVCKNPVGRYGTSQHYTKNQEKREGNAYSHGVSDSNFTIFFNFFFNF